MESQILDSELNGSINEENVKWAGFWIRVGASFIDFFALLPIVGLNLFNLYSIKSLPLEIAILLISILYKPFMEYQYGATLGKMAVNIKLVGADFNQINLTQAIIRNIPQLITQVISIYGTVLLFNHPDFASTTSFFGISNLQKEVTPTTINYIGTILLIVSCLVVAFFKKKQALHDMIANTYCIYK